MKNLSSEKKLKNKNSNSNNEILQSNQEYAKDFGNKGHLTIFARKQLAILTCMDSRIDPFKLTGLSEGDAFVIRNAGGRASDDAIRSLVLSSKFLNTKEWFVIHHTDCGMQTLTSAIIENLFKDSLEPATRDEYGNWQNKKRDQGSVEAFFIDWLTINNSVAECVAIDVHRLRNHPLVSKKIMIYGYIYDVHSGKLIPVPKAMEIGLKKSQK